MKYLMPLATLTLTGCGTYGEPLLLAAMYDRSDTCQNRNWPNGQEPQYCGGAKGYSRGVYVNGQCRGYIKTTR